MESSRLAFKVVEERIEISSPAVAQKPTNTRARIIAFGTSLAFLSFLDRAAIGQLGPSISKELHLTPFQMGMVFSVFGITYALGEMPSGWLCDRFGARALLTRVVFLWSFFMAATGWAWSFSSLLVTRLLFGAGERLERTPALRHTAAKDGRSSGECGGRGRGHSARARPARA